MPVRMPWGTPTVSDATKLGLRSQWAYRQLEFGQAGSRIYQLLYQLNTSDDFPNLANWSEVDSAANVNLAGGIVSLNGNNVANSNGIYLTAGLARAEGFVEFKVRWQTRGSFQEWLGIAAAGALATTAANALNLDARAGAAPAQALRANTTLGTSSFGIGAPTLIANEWFTLRIYVLKDGEGNFTAAAVTIQSATQFPEETLCGTHVTHNAAGGTMWNATLYPQFQRQTNDAANLTEIKEFRWYTGYDINGPTLTYVADAGAGKVIDNFDLTALAAVGGWATTNCTFAWSFDDGVAAYSAEFTLANLNAQGKQLGRHRYARIRVTVNSDGATQQYAGEINSDTACDGIGDFPEVNNTYVQDTVQLAAGTLTNPVERPECLTTNILGVNQQAFALGDTVYVNGTLEFVKALAAANVRVRVYNDAGVLQATLFNAAYNFLATTAVTLTAINGGVMLSHLPGAADGYYVEIVITHADLPNGSLTFFSGFAVAAAGGGGGPSSIRALDPVMLMLS